jgi:hypothetical protein
MTQKVLLLQGPVNSWGLNPVTEQLCFLVHEARADWRSMFNCDETIASLSHAFRALGYKIAYSGWADDAEWLNSHSQYFDYLTISDQSNLRAKSIRGERIINNNKEKLYFGSLRGLQKIEQELGPDVIVFKLRSDVSVNPFEADANMVRLIGRQGILLAEYLDTDKTLAFPDFMLMGNLEAMLAAYKHLYNLCITGTCYHVSSHCDHGFTYLRLLKDGVLVDVEFMSKKLFDSVVWRGIPRYFEYTFPKFSEKLFFDGRLGIERSVDFEALLASIPPELSGKEES